MGTVKSLMKTNESENGGRVRRRVRITIRLRRDMGKTLPIVHRTRRRTRPPKEIENRQENGGEPDLDANPLKERQLDRKTRVIREVPVRWCLADDSPQEITEDPGAA